MPTYVWACEACQQQTEIERKMADCDVGPDAACACGAKNFKKQIVINPKAPNYILQPGGTGWFRDQYTRTGRPIK